MQKAVEAIEAFIDGVGKLTLWITLLMIGLVATNVLLRYSMSVGSVWAQELEWHLLAALILLGICYALQRGDNVRVDVFYAGYSARRKYIVDLVSLALLLAVSLLFIKISVPYVMQSYVISEGSADPGGIAYRWVIKAFIPLGYVLVALQCAAAIARRVLQERGRV
ncbi:MAG: TRAP transporter small permease subunit [Betaproteobacteria bacterium]|jgi:TRAP-type mannitol/chloroaromatic compound transport system permease small subunit|nr:TRAP transporter small permease subunit [Betaproteobacteria bacterium]